MQYEAGAGTGFHVKSAHPDSDPLGNAFYSGPPGKPGGRPRGHSSIVLGKDGSYGFTASGPDQRRTEVSDSNGRVQGSYTYVDDKGVQRTVQYVAGPHIGYRVVNNAAAGGAASAGVVSIPTLLSGGTVIPVPASIVPPSAIPPDVVQISSSTPLSPSTFEQDLFGSTASTPTPFQPDRLRPAEFPVKGGSGGGDGSNVIGVAEGNGFLSSNSALPLGSAFPEDDPTLPPKKRPTMYKNKDEESFFQLFEKFDIRREQQQKPPKKPFAVPELPSHGYHLQPSSTSRPTAVGPPDTLYGQPARPIVVDDKYGQYGGTDYQKPKGQHHHSEFGSAGGHNNNEDANDHHNNFGGFPTGTIVKAHVQNLDILPFGHRVPSPSYVLERQFGGDYSNSIKK